MAKSVLQVYHVREDRGIHQLVNIRVNGLPARMLIDTGASHTVFCKRRIHYFDGEMNLNDAGFQAVGMGEDFDAYALPIIDFTVGKIHLSEYDAILADLSMLEQLYGPLIEGPVHGVLGGDLLSLPGSMISFRKNLLRLGGQRSVRFRALSIVPGTTHLVVQVKIMGKSANMFIDTGATVTIFNSKRFHELREYDESRLEPVEEPCKGVKDEQSALGVVTLKQVELGHVVLTDLPGRLIDLEGVNEAYLRLGYPPLDGLIGNDLLFAYQAELFPTDNKLIIRN